MTKLRDDDQGANIKHINDDPSRNAEQLAGEFQLMYAVINQAIDDLVDPTVNTEDRDSARHFLLSKNSNIYFSHINIDKKTVINKLKAGGVL